MRVALLACFAAVAACATGGGEPPPVTMPSEIIAEAPLPDFKPETAAACNAVRMSVFAASDGSFKVNDVTVDAAGLNAAAARKNQACLNAPAMVALSLGAGVTTQQADAIRETLAKAITNIALIEARAN